DLEGEPLDKQAEKTDGLARMHYGLALCRAGGELIQSHFLALLAETYGEMGQIEEGLAVLAEALATGHRIGEYFWEAELYRLKGELTLQQLKIKNAKLTITETPHQAANPQAEAEGYFL